MGFIITDDIEQYAFEHTRAEPELLQALSRQTWQKMKLPQMLTGRLEGRFLKMLVQLQQPKLIVEIGMFTGYSALSMAEGLPVEGKIITCDIDPNAQEMAQQAFDASPYGSKIEIKMGKALDTLASIDQSIDMAFIDADKASYPHYYEAILEKMPSGGLIVLDNMLWSGQVLKPKINDEDSQTLAALNQFICNDPRVENVMLTVRDGIQLVRKC